MVNSSAEPRAEAIPKEARSRCAAVRFNDCGEDIGTQDGWRHIRTAVSRRTPRPTKECTLRFPLSFMGNSRERMKL